MAEQVNQRVEEMINELEQMRRTSLYTEEELREISRKRKEFEYHIQRRVKQKEDYVQYIAYELALLENIAIRRRQSKLTEKKKDIEYAITKRLNRVFKQFIYRFQDDLLVYFEYIKFCKSVGFNSAVSGIIGQMLQIHGDKSKMWLLASKWESEEQNNLDSARSFLLKGIQRHPESEVLYLELFKIELLVLSFSTETEEEKEKQIKRADIVWKNGVKNVPTVSFLFKLMDLILKYNVESCIKDSIKGEIWSRRNEKEVWCYVAEKELEGCHWSEIEDFAKENKHFPDAVNNVMGIYEEALQQFPDQKLCAKYIHSILSLDDTVCTDAQKLKAVKHSWMFGHKSGLLDNDMYAFGINMFKLEGEMTNKELLELLASATEKNPKIRSVWEEKILLNKPNEKEMMAVLQDATKALKSEDAIHLYNVMLDNVVNNDTLKSLYNKFQNCENAVLLEVKPKLLRKMYEYNGLKAARELYEDLIRTPPVQLEVNQAMIYIEKEQEKPNVKNIRKYYECAVLHHGSSNIDIWMDYMNFETQLGSAANVALIYRRAIGMLKKEIVDDFIKVQTLAKLN